MFHMNNTNTPSDIRRNAQYLCLSLFTHILNINLLFPSNFSVYIKTVKTKTCIF